MALPCPEDPKARALQIELLRRAGTTRRAAIALSLSATTIELAREAIRRRHPEWSEREVLIEYGRVHYGVALGERLRARLSTRG